ncbi:O-succinylbenzoate--CoA ligase [Streptomyces sp. TM32]|uniref:class I adenylate-forming enzyme family protein n=1 Tax=Streptomyces sp. TM32 TaxID=1652669 RepID=UPI001010A912|nr:AMP-binding protein [Streptomyces sp. TM32]RXS69937.1 O-succinylbenzoate--CoA ligase [Streptomyces sp. TM32]
MAVAPGTDPTSSPAQATAPVAPPSAPPFTSPSPFTFTEALERAAALRTDPAVGDGTRRRTWHDLLLQAERTAGALLRRGLRSGDVLAAQLPNSWELVVLHAATARLGVLLLPLHCAYGAHEVQSLVTQAGAVALVAQGSYRGRDRVGEIRAVRDRCTSLRQVWVVGGGTSGTGAGAGADAARAAGAEPLPNAAELLDEAPGPAGELPEPPRDPGAPLMLLASSGTTSQRPKLCVHSHGGLLGNAAAVSADGGLGPADTIVSASPLSHAFGLLSVHLALVVGGRVGLFDGWEARRFLVALRGASATTAFLVPAQLRDVVALLADDPEAGGPPVVLREVRTGGAPVPRELAEDVRRTLGARLVVQWGMTEIGAGTFTRPGDPPEAASTVGRPVSGGRVRVVGPEGHRAGPGETGELQYRSPYMFRGYHGAPELTRAALTADGWLRTGDLAALAPDGSVSYRGRADALINRGGLKFSALEVEQLLDDLPQLAQHAVVARPDPRLGQRACLLAALRDGAGLTLDEVTGHLSRKGLATYKLPEELVVVDRLPTTVTGKIARSRLKAIPLPPLDPPRPSAPAAQPGPASRPAPAREEAGPVHEAADRHATKRTGER